MRPQSSPSYSLSSVARIRIWYGLLLLLTGIFVVRLFYLQIIRHEHYQKAALTTQLKEYQIPAARGIIEVQNGDDTVPIVLNEIKYTLYADPIYVEDPAAAALAVAGVIGGDATEYERQLTTKDTRYVVLAKKLDEDVKHRLDELELKGIGTREATYRTYPQGTLAAQLLGFVSDDGEGTYGLEQALNDRLKGTPGQIRAITDAQGVPLAGNKDNIVTEPEEGEHIVLTIDLGMQERLEEVLEEWAKKTKSSLAGAMIMDVNSGAIKAMANYPTYNPAEFFKVEDAAVFNNALVSAPMEVGSIIKPLTVAAAMNENKVNKNTTYHDPGSYRIDGATVRNVEISSGVGQRSMADILRMSLNTGATWLLMQMGDGSLGEKARTTWHDYLVNRYQFGKPTGVEQGYEAGGSVPHPTEGFGLDIQFANTAFGQGMTATMLQMGSALSAVLNGGTYYQPRLVHATVNDEGQQQLKESIVKQQNVVRPEVGRGVADLMEETFTAGHAIYGMRELRPAFRIGGKTGTAQVPRPDGGYYEDRFNGTFMGWVGGNEPQYVILVRVDTPKVGGYAGTTAAAPIFAELATALIDNFGVTPKQ